MVRGKVLIKARLNLKIERDLKEWAVQYVSRNSTTLTELITGYLEFIRERDTDENKDLVEQI